MALFPTRDLCSLAGTSTEIRGFLLHDGWEPAHSNLYCDTPVEKISPPQGCCQRSSRNFITAKMCTRKYIPISWPSPFLVSHRHMFPFPPTSCWAASLRGGHHRSTREEAWPRWNSRPWVAGAWQRWAFWR